MDPRSTLVETEKEMKRSVHDFDWSRTSLGPIQPWPAALRHAVDLCLHSALPMLVWWGDELTTIYNDAYIPLLGKKHPQALGKPAREVWSEAWPDIVVDVESVLTSGTAVVRERVRFVMGHNERPQETFFSYSYSPITDNSGKIRGLFQVCMDETARVRAERERDQLSNQARVILESITDAFFAVADDWRFTYVNPQADKLLDRKSGDLIGKNIWEMYPGLVASVFEPVYRRAAEQRVPSSITAYYPDHERWYEVRIYPSPTGGISVYFQDVSQRVRDDLALRDSMALLHGISDSTGDVIFAKDLQGRLQYANRAVVELVGKPLEQILGHTDAEFLEDKNAARVVMENDRRILSAGVAEDVEEVVPMPDGTARIWQSRKMPNLDSNGKVVGLLGVSRDITDRERAWQRLKRLYDVAAALSQAISPLDVAKVTVEQGLAAVGANAGSLVLFTEDGTHLETIGSAGYTPEVAALWKRVPVGTGIPLVEAACSGQAVYLESPQERLERYPLLAGVKAPRGTQSSACLPLLIGERSLGALGLSFEKAGRLSDEDREFATSLARQCAQALERAKLFETEQTARAEAERAEAAARDLLRRLEQQSRLFERIASSTPDFIYIFDLNYRFVYANRRLLEVWGVPAEQALGKSLIELGYPQWHVDMHHRELRQVIETRQPIKGEVPFTGGSGISGVYEYIFTPVLDPQGNVEVVAGTTRDISERKHAEAALRASEQSFRQLADAMPQIVWAAQPDGILDYYNHRWFEYIQIPEAQAGEATQWSQYVHADDVERVAQSWAKSLESGEPYHTEFRVRGGDGEFRWFLVRAAAVRNSEGQIIRWFGTCTDIHAMKQLTHEREQLLASEQAARLEAERAGRMKDEFLATLSHELRTPLNAILGWATILTSQPPGADDLREGLETIQRNARAQTQIIEDLLDMSRIISGKVRLEVQRTELVPVLQAAIETVRPAAAAKGVKLRSVLDPHAGPVSGDGNRLQQVFWNLLSNAVKFTPKNGNVQLVLERVDSHLEISVSDSGEGIRPEFLPHVFDRFRQADASTTRRHGGLGLGLAIVKQLVEMHGGTVVVRSSGPGQGSTFTVKLPMTVLHQDSDSDSPQRRHPAAPVDHASHTESDICGPLTGVRVLVVDDEPDARALVKRLLEDCEAIVSVADSSSQAIGIINQQPVDVLISDIGMPGEDGYSLIRKVRNLPKDHGGTIPAVALTAYARSEDRVKAIRAGFQMHVVKPVDPAELITVVASLARRTQ